ncbi:OmpH family outer membrane protein [Bacteroidota bacterium]
MKSVLVILAITILSPVISKAQKIGYADVNAILTSLPDNERVNDDLKVYAMGLQKQLDDMSEKLKNLAEEYSKNLEAGDSAKAAAIQTEGIALNDKITEEKGKAEQRLADKRTDLLQPVLDKIHAAMGAVAEREGYASILNNLDGSGTSIVLWSPEKNNLTSKIIQQCLNPEAAEAAAIEESSKRKKKKK